MKLNKIRNFLFYTLILMFSVASMMSALERSWMLSCACIIVSFLGMIALMSVWCYEELVCINRKVGLR